jgi:heme-degrading monooxygenase HmoA
MATTQKGYVCGETLVNADNLEEWIVISSWDNLDSWRDWRISPQRAEINDKLEFLLGTEAECNAYFYGDNHLYLQQEK